ncbi:MAG: hypothetical protein U0V70_20370 [Terriglobia bacterium]
MTNETDDQTILNHAFAPTEKPAYSEDGVDLTLIRWMLSLTPAERLQVLQEQVKSILRLRDGQPGTKLRGDS